MKTIVEASIDISPIIRFIDYFTQVETKIPESLSAELKVYGIRNNPSPAQLDYMINFDLAHKSVPSNVFTLISISLFHFEDSLMTVIAAHGEDEVLGCDGDFVHAMDKIFLSKDTEDFYSEIFSFAQLENVKGVNQEFHACQEEKKLETSSYRRPHDLSRNDYWTVAMSKTASINDEASSKLGIPYIENLRKDIKIRGSKYGKDIKIIVPASIHHSNFQGSSSFFNQVTRKLIQRGFKISRMRGKGIVRVSGRLGKNIEVIKPLLMQDNPYTGNMPEIQIRLSNDYVHVAQQPRKKRGKKN